MVISLLAAHGLRHMTRHSTARTRWALVLTLCVAGLLEYRFGSPATLPVPTSDAVIPKAYSDMRSDPEPGAVLDLPLAVPNLERAVYVWYQTAHGRPVPWGLNDPMPEPLLRNRFTATLIRLEAHRSRSSPPALPELDMVVGARSMAMQGYRYIVLHEDLYPAFKRVQVEALLSGLFGAPRRYPSDGLQVYTL